MGTKENFNQAIAEVFPFYKNGKKAAMEVELSSSNLAKQADGEPGEPKSPVLLDFQTSSEVKKQQSIDTAHITKDTKMTGTIVSKSNLDICGDVYGDVESQNSIKISGRIEGNISGKNIEINNAIIKGNIYASERLVVLNQSEILGNIFANELEFNSKISGNITVKRTINILKESTVVGDITAMTIGIEKGAIIKSVLNVTGERKSSDEGVPL